MCDVNIHPTKKEFKYENEKELFTTVYHAVSEALRDRELMPEWKDEDNTKQTAAGTIQQKPANNQYQTSQAAGSFKSGDAQAGNDRETQKTTAETVNISGSVRINNDQKPRCCRKKNVLFNGCLCRPAESESAILLFVPVPLHDLFQFFERDGFVDRNDLSSDHICTSLKYYL
jgi:DNA mismatch repair ATPase MutL